MFNSLKRGAKAFLDGIFEAAAARRPRDVKRPRYVLQDRGETHVVNKATGATVPMKYAHLMVYGKKYPSHGAKRSGQRIPVVPFGVAAE